MTIQARQITATLRELLPQVQPLRTTRLVSDNGLVLSFEVVMPETAARHISINMLAGAYWLDDYLTRHLGQQVHVHSSYATRRRDCSKLAHIIIKTGRRPS